MKTSLASLKEHHFDPIRDSQQIFRELMMALAFPGKIHQLRPLSLAGVAADFQYLLQPLLTLLDLESAFHVHASDPELQETITRYLSINTNSRSTERTEADFVLCLDPTLDGGFAKLKKGSLAQPNDSATVFYRVDGITAEPEGDGVGLTLQGPGIRSQRSVRVTGLSPAEIDQWARSRRDYPMGIDIYLISRGGDLVGLPRSVELTVSGGLA
jgi:alpha-D-ribose 1-methylphosphonate 5-triphosphate synthase subunit PhnH